MHRISLDILEKAQLPGEQAKSILEAMDFELASRQEALATKDDLARELARFEVILRSSLNDLRAEMRSEMSDLRMELKERLFAIELQIQSQRAEMARWILGSSGALIGAFGVMLGLFYFFTNLAGK